MKSIKSQVSNIVAVLVLVVLLFSLGVTFFKVSELRQRVTGFATSYGYINITIASLSNLVVYNDTINWGSGYITSLAAGQYKYANLSTNDDGNATVINGNWSTTNAKAITIANEGNVNCSLSIQSAKNAADIFASGLTANQTYAWNITEKDLSSCGLGAAGVGKNLTTFYLWRDFNKSSQNICSQFDFHSGANRVYLNVRLQVPYDATVFGNNNDTITITCV